MRTLHPGQSKRRERRNKPNLWRRITRFDRLLRVNHIGSHQNAPTNERAHSEYSLIWIKNGTMDITSAPAGRIALFIDGPNFHATARALGFDVDYGRLLAEFQKGRKLVRAHYYTTIIDDQEYSAVRPLVDWLGYNGYTVVTKPAKEYVDASSHRRTKGNMGIELAVDALQLAEHLDDMVLFSGDSDFCPLVEAIQRRGVRVSVVSTRATTPPMVADELRRQADMFVDLVDLKAALKRSL